MKGIERRIEALEKQSSEQKKTSVVLRFYDVDGGDIPELNEIHGGDAVIFSIPRNGRDQELEAVNVRFVKSDGNGGRLQCDGSHRRT